MTKLPIFPGLCLYLILGFWSAANAWQETAPEAVPAAGNNAEPQTQEYVAEESPEATAIVLQARDRLFQHQTVRADMVQVVSLRNQKFRSTGSYLAGSEFRYRLEFQVQLQDLEGSFLEVCDGQILHTRRQILEARPSLASTAPPEVDLTRRDIQKILKEARLHQNSPPALRAAQMGLGGLTSVLASLEQTMIFDAVRPETVDGRDYLVVQGRWKGNEGDKLLAQFGPFGRQFSPFMPDLVRIYFSRETLFPEKFLYLKRASEDRNTFRAIVTIEFQNVVIDQPLPAQVFTYVTTPGIEERDETGMFLQMIQEQDAPPAEPPAAVPSSTTS